MSDPPQCQQLLNVGTHFTVEVLVGTPPQRFELVADTGSDAIIVQSCLCRTQTDECKETEDCFVGTGKSSTFVNPPPNRSLMYLSFGSGDILTAVATDVVRVGQAQATMKDSLLLMVNRALDMPGHFEGILGLGIPSWIEGAEDPPKMAGVDGIDPEGSMIAAHQVNSTTALGSHRKNDGEPHKVKVEAPTEPVPRFMEEAGVESFSICMNDGGQPGVLRMQPPDAPKMLKQVGHHHWSLDFQGLSVGASDAPVVVCDKASKEPSQYTACSFIPDSGSTLILGPRDGVNKLYAELCQRWPRCMQNIDESAPSLHETFRTQVATCGNWIDDGLGLSEMPSLFVHLGGADGDTQTLELSAWSYVIQMVNWDGEQVCETLIGEFEYHTVLHGPIWIFGTPLFYEYQVVFAATRPDATMGFSSDDCGSCDGVGTLPTGGDNTSLVVDSGLRRGHNRRIPRMMRGPPRMPSFDPMQPL